MKIFIFVMMSDLQELKSNFLSGIADIVQLEEVPPSLVINLDHTALKYVLVSSWIMAKEGSQLSWRLLWKVSFFHPS